MKDEIDKSRHLRTKSELRISSIFKNNDHTPEKRRFCHFNIPNRYDKKRQSAQSITPYKNLSNLELDFQKQSEVNNSLFK